MHQPPEGYRVSSYCRSCGNDFAADYLFERHLTGVHEYTYSQGLQFDPPLEDGRRCMTEEEMLAAGMRPMTQEEKLASKRHNHRAAFDVKLWFDESEARRAREAFAGTAG